MGAAEETEVVAMETEAAEPTKAVTETISVALICAELKSALTLLERYAVAREPRFATSALRLQVSIRKKTSVNADFAAAALSLTISQLFPAAHPLHTQLLAALPSMKAASAAEGDSSEKKEAKKPLSPEGEVFIATLVLLFLIDTKRFEEAASCSLSLLERIACWNRRTLDMFAERAYFFASWSHECAGRLQAIRSPLLAAYRTAALHHNVPCQATILNLLLRNYQHYKLFDQADKLLAKSSFPELASNCQLARFLYYNGRIKALQLEYSDAHRCLLQAQRKAPSTRGLGFRLTVHKLSTIVQLLLGEIPERAIFRQPDSRVPMLPYLKLVQAVRRGDLQAFKTAMQEDSAVFAADGNSTLVVRLRQNVIRAGLRNISVAYSRISLADVAAKLHLDQPEDMESIAAKAIRDGVIDASLDHAAGVLLSAAPQDVYSTLEPQAAFHKRITFCLNVHNDAVKAMSYPADAHKGELPDAETLKERQREESELAQSLAEEDDEF